MWCSETKQWRSFHLKIHNPSLTSWSVTNEHYANFLTSTPQNCQGHGKHGKSEKLSQPRAAKRQTKTKANCNLVYWTNSWNRKRTFDKNWDSSNKLWAPVNNNNISSFIVANKPHECKMFIIEGSGCRACGDPVYCLYSFSVNLKLFSNWGYFLKS